MNIAGEVAAVVVAFFVVRWVAQKWSARGSADEHSQQLEAKNKHMR